MTAWLRDLVAHKGHADAAMLRAVIDHPPARADHAVRVLLHHMLVSNRFWLLSIVGEAFMADVETVVPVSLPPLIAGFRVTHEREQAWLAEATDAALSRTLDDTRIPGGRCLVSDALLQVCLHSHGHRSQCAKLLRGLGGHPPATDFIVWRVVRAAPVWPSEA